MSWIILVLLSLGGYFIYNYLVTLEKEIRAEISSGEDASLSSVVTDQADVPGDQAISLAQRIESIVQGRPGLLQLTLYGEIPDVEKNVLQKALLDLDRSGRILRTRSGNTFKLNLTG